MIQPPAHTADLAESRGGLYKLSCEPTPHHYVKIARGGTHTHTQRQHNNFKAGRPSQRFPETLAHTVKLVHRNVSTRLCVTHKSKPVQQFKQTFTHSLHSARVQQQRQCWRARVTVLSPSVVNCPTGPVSQ